jgi:hypothetical protein
LGQGAGSELRQPMGIAFIGGLPVSQWLTLYTTPVVYLCLDRFAAWLGRSYRQPRLAERLSRCCSSRLEAKSAAAPNSGDIG